MLSTAKTDSRGALVFTKDKLTVKVYPTMEQMGASAEEEVSARICELLSHKEEINMIFAAAPSQSSFLKCLAEDSRIDFTRINAFHMDEYVGIDKSAPQSFANFLERSIFSLAPFKSVHYLNGAADSIEDECRRYGSILEQYPVDIVCLGIGENGHIAFNDPPVADFNDPVRVKLVELEHTCRQQQVNEKCFDTLDQVPTHAMTLTVPSLMAADWMFCIVPFVNKAEAVRRTLCDEVSTACPATILRTRENVCLCLNNDSASLL